MRLPIYLRGGNWHFRKSYKGQLIQKALGTSDVKAAQKSALEILHQIETGEWFKNAEPPKTLGEMIERYEKECLPKKKNQARDKSIFKHLTEFFGKNIALRDIEKTIAKYEGHRVKYVKPATIVKELGLLRRMFNVARKWRWHEGTNPVSFIDMPRVNNAIVRYLEPEEYENLFRVLNDVETPKWLKPIVVMGLNTGLRLSNLLNLKWSEVNTSARMITIKGLHMKNNENLGLPLTQEAYETLCELQQARQIEGYVFHDSGQRIYPVKYQRAVKKAYAAAGIENFRPAHDLRHSYASYLRQKGVDLHTISKLLGHKSTRMSERYSHLSVESLRAAVSVLDEGLCTNHVQPKEKRATANAVTP